MAKLKTGTTIGGNLVWHAGNDGTGSGLDADKLDGIDSSQFIRSDADDTVSGQITFNNATHIISDLNIGSSSDTTTRNLRLFGSSVGVSSTLKCTNGNLHIDAETGSYATYINYYEGAGGVAFGNGASSTVAWMGPDGDLWKGNADNTGSKYWHAGNDGSGSGLNADYVDGLHASQFLRSDTSTTISTATPVLSLNDINSTNTTNQTGFISFKNNGTETGWVGFGSNVDSDFTVRNTSGAVELYGSDGAKVTGKLLVNGADDNGDNAKFAVDIDDDAVIAIHGQQVRVGNTSSNYSYKMMYSGGNAYMDTWASNLYLRSTGGSVDRDIIIIPNRLGAATEAARFTGAGSLLINATTPVASEKLLVAGSTHIQVASGLEQLRLERTGTNTGTVVLGAAGDGLYVMDTTYAHKMYVGVAGTYNGRVGIGTQTPTTNLEVVGNAKVSTHIIAREMRTSTAQELVLNAGESASYSTGQTNELVYANAEGGLEINSSPDNWATGWAGRQTAYINNSFGDSSLPNNLTVGSTVYLQNSSLALSQDASTTLKITTPTGWVTIGSNNASYAHLYTDRANFYFSKPITVGGNIVNSYNADLELRRNASTSNRLRITATETISDQKLNVTGSVTADDFFTVNPIDSRLKYKLWSESSVYGIGMDSAYSFGGINNNYAMTFQMDSTAGRGYWWGTDVQTNAQGAMALTTSGELTVANKIKVGAGNADTSAPEYPLEVVGTAGQLFSVTDSLDGTIFSVNDMSGLPSIEVDDDGVIRLAEYGGNILIGTNVDNGTDKLQVSGTALFANTVYLANSNTALSQNSTTSGTLRIDTPTGYLSLGSGNSSWVHFGTDRFAYYFDKYLSIAGNRVDSYDNDFELRRAESTTARLRITSGLTYSDQNFYVAGSITTSGSIDVNNSNIVGVNALQFEDPGPGEGIEWISGNIKIFESPDDLVTNTAGNLQVTYGGTRRLTVNSSGIDVNGTITNSGSIISEGAGHRVAIGTDSGGSISMGRIDGVASSSYIDFNTGTSVTDYDTRIAATGGTGTTGQGVLAIYASTFEVSANASFNDSKRAMFGTGNDLQIYHNGSASYIDDVGTGSLFVRGNNLYLQKYTGESYIGCVADSSVILYYNGLERLTTTSTGISTSRVTISDVATMTVYNETDNIGTGQWWRHVIDSGNMRWDVDTTTTNGDGTFTSYDTTLRLNTNGSVDLYYDNSVKLSTTSTGITVTGDVNSTSDEKLKENVETIQTPREKVNKLRGVNFTWKDSGTYSMGLIAQEVEEIVPEVVKNESIGKTVNYQALVGLLVESIKDQQAQIDEQNARIEKLESLINSMLPKE